MKSTKIKAIYQKEILDLLRDKKTLIMMVLVPLLLYPLIMIAVMLIASAISNNMQTSTYQISVETADGYSFEEMERLKELLEDTTDGLDYHLMITEQEDCETALLAEDIDAYIVMNEKASIPSFEVFYLSSVTNSSMAADMIDDKLKLYREQTEKTMLEELNLDAELIMNPIAVEWTDKSSKEEHLGNILGSILPFLLITSILMGAVYPAIDTTAGEKERGTLETLLTLPVRNDELIMGKFLAVATVSIVSALLNLLSMGLMGAYIYQVMLISDQEAASIDFTGFIPAAVIVVLCVLVFSLFISALTMCVTIFAKSFKEANNYVTPLLLVVMLTGYISFIPNVELTPFMASIPVVNICLLIHNLLMFKFEFSTIFIVLSTNIAYACLAILALSKLYDSEDILFGEGGVSLQMFTSRKNLKKGGVPNFSDAVLVAAVSMLLILYAGTVLQMKFLLLGLFLTQLLVIGVPVLAAWYTKKDFRMTFSLKMPKAADLLGALLLEIGVFLLILLLSTLLIQLWPQDAGNVNDSFSQILSDVSFFPALLVIAVTPAICEEALFRGYLFSAAKKKLKPMTAILVVAALFGIYHLSFVKFFTTGLLGIALCYVVYKTGSIFPAMLMHFFNNAVSVVIMYDPKQLEKIVPVLFKDELAVSEYVIILLTGLIFSLAGILILRRLKESK